jgi:lysophospholipase L1-like esterase
LDNGLLDGINPKLVVLLIGSNHVNNYEAEEIIDGIQTIACSIRTKLPETKLLLVGVLPRGTASPAGAYRLAKASEGASKIADNRTIHYLDVAERFFDKNGNVSLELMTEDRVHLSEAGYFTLADALRPTIVGLMSK